MTVHHTLQSLLSLCGCFCVLFLFFPPLLSPSLFFVCFPSIARVYLVVANAFQAASSSLGILEAQQSPHKHTFFHIHTLIYTYRLKLEYSVNSFLCLCVCVNIRFFSLLVGRLLRYLESAFCIFSCLVSGSSFHFLVLF